MDELAVRIRRLSRSLPWCIALAFSLAAQAARAAPAPPTAYTGAYRDLTSSSITLEGSTYPSSQTTDYYFQYGQTGSYGVQTPLTQAGAGTQTIHVEAAIAGLSPYTTYHYRLVAVNPTGTVDGQDRAFTTKKIPLSFKVFFPSPSREVFGSSFSVSGTLSGTGSANHAVTLEANAFPYVAGFKPISGPKLTNANGSFSFAAVGLLQSSQLRVAAVETPPADSRVTIEHVAVRVTLHVRPTGRAGFARLYGVVQPAQPVALVDFQMLTRGQKPAFVSSVVVKAGRGGVCRFNRVVRIRQSGLYRAFALTSGGAQVSNHSRAILIG